MIPWRRYPNELDPLSEPIRRFTGHLFHGSPVIYSRANNLENERWIGYEVSPPEPPWFSQQPGKPFHPIFLEHRVRAFDSPCIKIEHRPYGTNKLYIEPVSVLVYPFFLFRGGHSNPQNVRVGFIYDLDHLFIVPFAEGIPERRGITANHPNLRIINHHPPLDLLQHLRGRPQKKEAPPPSSAENIG